MLILFSALDIQCPPVVRDREIFDKAGLDNDSASFSYHEEFIPRMLYVLFTCFAVVGSSASPGCDMAYIVRRNGKILAFYRHKYGDRADQSYIFLRAWNELKALLVNSRFQQANFFCGSRLHHWNFVVGLVEIGSGSHEDKRQAFRLAP
ncbi:hypothetical protein Plhal304r1_c133g0176761 [Plasmopara halstedii]